MKIERLPRGIAISDLKPEAQVKYLHGMLLAEVNTYRERAEAFKPMFVALLSEKYPEKDGRGDDFNESEEYETYCGFVNATEAIAETIEALKRSLEEETRTR